MVPRFRGLLALDGVSLLATFGAGSPGPEIEAALRPHGLTLGHIPQSFEYSTLGGWVATRSSGQQSLRYGRIEDLLAGAHVETPEGPLDLPPFPASAAGPDLRHVVLGSEGRLGVITEATVRVSRASTREVFSAAVFPAWPAALEAARTLARSGLDLSMIRLSGPSETATTLALSPRTWRSAMLGRYLAARGVREGACLLLIGVSGTERGVRRARRDALALARAAGGVPVGEGPGRAWARARFRLPYLRDAAWERGFGVDTVETAVPWARVPAMVEAVEDALRDGLAADGERVHAYSHLSHVYTHGSSVYTTFAFRLAQDPDETLARWRTLKAAASTAIQAQGGTISHHHGVGRDSREYLPAEKGPLGMALLRAAFNAADPAGTLNPGALL